MHVCIDRAASLEHFSFYVQSWATVTVIQGATGEGWVSCMLGEPNSCLITLGSYNTDISSSSRSSLHLNNDFLLMFHLADPKPSDWHWSWHGYKR